MKQSNQEEFLKGCAFMLGGIGLVLGTIPFVPWPAKLLVGVAVLIMGGWHAWQVHHRGEQEEQRPHRPQQRPPNYYEYKTVDVSGHRSLRN